MLKPFVIICVVGVVVGNVSIVVGTSMAATTVVGTSIVAATVVVKVTASN